VVRVRRDFVLLLVGAVMLVLSSLAVDKHHLSGLETAVFRVVNDLPGFIYKPLWLFMQLGNLFVIPAAALVSLLARRRRLAGGILVAGLATYVLAKVVKRIVSRPRPFLLLTGVHVHGAAGRGLGYVSGHAGVVAALITVAWPWLSKRARWAVVAVGMGVWLGRMYVGAHLPLDILGGAALGIAVGAAGAAALRPAGGGGISGPAGRCLGRQREERRARLGAARVLQRDKTLDDEAQGRTARAVGGHMGSHVDPVRAPRSGRGYTGTKRYSGSPLTARKARASRGPTTRRRSGRALSGRPASPRTTRVGTDSRAGAPSNRGKGRPARTAPDPLRALRDERARTSR